MTDQDAAHAPDCPQSWKERGLLSGVQPCTCKPETLSEEELGRIEKRPFEIITEASASAMARELLNRRRVSRNHASEISAQALHHEATHAELLSLRAENEKLRREISDAMVALGSYAPDDSTLAESVERMIQDANEAEKVGEQKAKARVEALREALLGYGEHPSRS